MDPPAQGEIPLEVVREIVASMAKPQEEVMVEESITEARVEDGTVDLLMALDEYEALRQRYDALQEKIAAVKAEHVKEPASLEAIQRMATELGVGFLIVKDSRYLVVPRRFLPDETKYLGTNNYMGIKMRGYLQDDGLVVQEKVELIR